MNPTRFACRLLLVAMLLPSVTGSKVAASEATADWRQSVSSIARHPVAHDLHQAFNPGAASFDPERKHLLVAGEGMLSIDESTGGRILHGAGTLAEHGSIIRGIKRVAHDQVLVWGSVFDHTCFRALVNSTGEIRWRRHLEPRVRCNREPMFLADGSYVDTRIVQELDENLLQIYRVSPDGRETAVLTEPLTVDVNATLDANLDATGTKVSIIVTSWLSSPPLPAIALQVDLNSKRMLWSHQLPSDASISLIAEPIQVDQDGATWIMYRRSVDHRLAGFTRTGELIRDIPLPATEVGYTRSALLLSNNGLIYLVQLSNTSSVLAPRRISGINFQGERVWLDERTDHQCENYRCTAALARNGDLILSSQFSSTAWSPSFAIERYAPDGQLRFSRSFEMLPRIELRSLINQADLHHSRVIELESDHLLFYQFGARDWLDFGNLPSLPDPQEPVEIVQVIDSDGSSVLRSELPDLGLNRRRPLSVLGDDGSVYLLSLSAGEYPSGYRGATPSLVRISPDGVVLWRQQVDAHPIQHERMAMSICGSNVCIAHPEVGLFAVDSGTGEARWNVSSPGPQPANSPSVLHATSIGSVFLSTPGPSVALFDREGHELGRWVSAWVEAFNPDTGAVLWNGTDHVQIDPQGVASTYSGPVPPCSTCPGPRQIEEVLHDDGEITQLAFDHYGSSPSLYSQYLVTRFRNGNTLWSITLIDRPDRRGLFETQIVEIEQGGVAVLYREQLAPQPQRQIETRSLRLFGISAQGQLLWQRDLTEGTLTNSRLVTRRDGMLALVGERAEEKRLALMRLDPESGEVLRHSTIPCPHGNCPKSQLLLGDDNAVVVVGAGGGLAGNDFEVGRYSGVLQTLEPIRLDQSALEGAWYSDYGSGQGFKLRYFPTEPSGGMLFLPWFTFAREWNNQPETLRWYTLQAQVPSGATRLELPILESIGGRFDHPDRNLREVGKAQLRFISCDQGILDYRFTDSDSEGASGTIALRRLLPRHEDCQTSSGPVLPAQRALNTSFSGSWYEPRTSGQGLDLMFIDPEHGSNTPGVFFGS